MKRVSSEELVDLEINSLVLKRLTDQGFDTCIVCGTRYPAKEGDVCGCDANFCPDCSGNIFRCVDDSCLCNKMDSCTQCLFELERSDWGKICASVSIPCFGIDCISLITKISGHKSLNHDFHLVCVKCLKKELLMQKKINK